MVNKDTFVGFRGLDHSPPGSDLGMVMNFISNS